MNHDEVLMDRLRSIARTVDDPPAWLRQLAEAALATRRIDGELAELMMDSQASQGALVRAADDAVRLLSFETSTVSVELQLEEVDERLNLRGLVTGASGEAVVETFSEARTVPINAEGWFEARDLPRGAIRLRLRSLDGSTVTTTWVSK